MTKVERDKEYENEPKRHLWIQIMGVPASGKTTLGKDISEQLGFSFMGEVSVDDNSLFEKYYKDPKKWSLSMQMSFLFDKRRQIVGAEDFGEIGIKKLLKKGPVISEPPIYQDGLYAQARLEQSPREMKMYKDFFEGMVGDNFQKPDLLVYIRLSFSTFLNRVRERAEKDPARSVELAESEEYWKRLWELHEEWIEENPLDLDIIVIDGDELDFSKYDDVEEAKADILSEFTRLAKNNFVNSETDKREILRNVILPDALI
jgi:deoxyadenosine/deoxycytidine kinase